MFVQAIRLFYLPFKAVAVVGPLKAALANRNQYLRKNRRGFGLGKGKKLKTQRIQIKRRTLAKKLTNQLFTAQAFFFRKCIGNGFSGELILGGRHEIRLAVC